MNTRIGVIPLYAVGIILSAITFKVIKDYENNKIQLDLERCAENRMTALQRGLEASFLVLESMSAFYDSAAAMSRWDFNRLVQPLLKNNIAVQALEWIPRVAQAQTIYSSAIFKIRISTGQKHSYVFTGPLNMVFS